jgi:hypothetical protein
MMASMTHKVAQILTHYHTTKASGANTRYLRLPILLRLATTPCSTPYPHILITYQHQHCCTISPYSKLYPHHVHVITCPMLQFYSLALNALGGLPRPSAPAAVAAVSAAIVTPAVVALVRAHFRWSHQIY